MTLIPDSTDENAPQSTNGSAVRGLRSLCAMGEITLPRSLAVCLASTTHCFGIAILFQISRSTRNEYATHFTQQKGADQRLLADVLWPLIEDDHLAHDHYGHFHTGHERPFPIANDDTITTYVGQPVPVEPTGPVTDRIRRWVSAELYARQKLGR